MSNERGMAKEYLKFFLNRIEVIGKNIKIVANTVALCNFSLIKKTGGAADVLTAVPPVVMTWLPSPYTQRTKSVSELIICFFIYRNKQKLLVKGEKPAQFATNRAITQRDWEQSLLP